MILPKGVYFVSGIDTDAGKSYATGILARMILKEQGGEKSSVITQKLVQTGCLFEEGSEDIRLHRDLMQIPMQPADQERLTCTEIFRFPASPHLSARIEGRVVDFDRISEATDALAMQYDIVLIEGAGGLMVPLLKFGERAGGNPQFLTLDYVQQREIPVLFVTSAKLGSLNHTLLGLEACRTREMAVAGVLWNRYPAGDPQIAADTYDYITQYLKFYYPGAKMIEIPDVSGV